MAQATQQKNKSVFKLDESFSTFAIDDVGAASKFYKDKLGIEVTDQKEGGIALKLGSQSVYLYPKEDHKPATFTVLNFAVTDIDAAVDELKSRGIEFESYGGDIATDDKGIFRGGDKNQGPNLAWFKDPAGNILSVIEQK
jgi:catechol 2,3-dioxygenase-like lactoylglutathione lyase family enzyme